MKNLKLLIEYDGTRYSGWQIQNPPKKPAIKTKNRTIQGEVEKALKKILNEKCKLIGAGRTDAGVHAKGYVANFNTAKNISCDCLQKALNSLLPDDIVIHKVTKVPLKFHSRFDAKSKTYQYSVFNGPYLPAIGRDYIYYFPFKLDVAAMRQAGKYLIGKHDFSSFGSKGRKKTNPNCTILKLDIKNSGQIIFNIEADYFLYKMARNIVGTLLEVGRGKISPSDVKSILKAKNRCKAGPPAPAKGLCLVKVKY